MKRVLLIVVLLVFLIGGKSFALISSPPMYYFGEQELKGIESVNYNDYSQNLTILGFPMVSSAMWFKDLPLLNLVLDIYTFIAYNDNVRTLVTYLNFQRTLKSIEYNFNKSDFSAVFYYSSGMNNYYNSMIRDLSISDGKYYFKTHMYLGFNYYLN